MPTVTEAYEDIVKDEGSEAPFLGSSYKKDPSKDDIRVRYFVGALTDENDRVLLEYIMTRSMMCKDSLDEEGDVVVLSEQGTFDKDGVYNVVVKYLELMEKAEKKDEVL